METPETYLKWAMSARLRGNEKESDRLCDLAEQAMATRNRPLKQEREFGDRSINSASAWIKAVFSPAAHPRRR
jgi:hypothetical protein